MEEQLKEDEAEVAEHWFSKWERQCLNTAEQEEQLPPEIRDKEDEEAVGPKSEQQKLWHLFQISATSVAQLYRGSGYPQPELSMWDPFQSAAMAVTSLYKESGKAHQRSFDLGVQVGYQRRIKDVLDWVKKGRSTIHREDLISFLCGKVPPAPPPQHTPRTAPKPPAGASSQAAATESSSSVDVDLQPFHEAIALHGLSGAMATISVQSGPPSSPPQASGVSSSVTSAGLQRSSILEDDLNSSDSEDLPLHLASGGSRKRTLAQCGEGVSDSPTHKRNRMV
ncbi:HUWE1-associated protein modifying stress responses 2 [Pteronotus mesoamericanus]|uniref:HUWE1-associated protein modifying stress responses 2 n=1 Tax=Pteronotus mesoamericanus TaxID=1884717 RepID=UPI0023EBEC7A|nr:HUWE1-associated protein modifying stress responses [Pteronotus parnellii mesoamericanus]